MYPGKLILHRRGGGLCWPAGINLICFEKVYTGVGLALMSCYSNTRIYTHSFSHVLVQ